MAAVDSTDRLCSAIGEALGYSFFGSQDPKTQLLSRIAHLQALLILDNFDHLLEGCGLVVDLLTTAPQLSILVTSRERLNLRQEWVIPLEGLPFPNEHGQQQSETYSAVQLFAQMAQRVQPTFDLASAETAVVSICRAVEGTPLAIELAASWLRMMPCDKVANHIKDGLDFLTTVQRDVPTRHRSLRAVFEQSWALLSPTERQALCRLSIFKGGFDIPAVEAVVGASLSMLAALVDKSLVRRVSADRYDLHELLRQYASEHLVDVGDMPGVRQRHLAFYLYLAKDAEWMVFGAQQVAWLDHLEREHNNLRSALTWALNGGDLLSGLDLAGTLGWFWYMRCHWNEGRQWLQRALHACQTAPNTIRARALNTSAFIAFVQNDLLEATTLAQEALILSHAVDDTWNSSVSHTILGGTAFIHKDYHKATRFLEEARRAFEEAGLRWATTLPLNHLGHIALSEGNFKRAAAVFTEMLVISRDKENIDTIAWSLFLLGSLALIQGDAAQARMRYEECLPLARLVRNGRVIALALHGLGRAALAQGDYKQADLYLNDSLSLHREFGLQSELAWNLYSLGQLAHALGNYHSARALFKEGLQVVQALGQTAITALCLAGLAALALMERQLRRAAQLLGAVEVQAEASDRLIVWDAAARTWYEATLASVCAELGEAMCLTAIAQGKSMTLNEVLVCALEEPGSST